MLDATQLRQLAYEALTDPRTVRRCYEGKPVGPLTRARIAKALVELRKRGHKMPSPPSAVAVGRA